ncbi:MULTISPECIES: MFS transporter [unclassified Rhizobium]|uniref:MFS transporter n=1 Tax=unclassified Rhizobium TaxID=2613769 RepID=UPI001ADBB761|nr:MULTISPECIES: MFS transporter [unclassified Rhizobium]MBO9097574.1 MFS transporter [Rhizobium sp. L58/93]MBO9133021.1 MFS transporter [Rhizobium sp. B209b/85]MBO9168440.1 MFS transporter [Rhizobium sp. L245/93]MBO9183773.1 MFS transporter [Rhizobium sp. E27B/91]QXZ84581.1 MFS transporter [Rhizobium sp. K1/93]
MSQDHANPKSSTLEEDARDLHRGETSAPANVSIGVIIGRTSEFFDFFVYGIASVLVFPRLMFPFIDGETNRILCSFAVFSLAFIARPFGSLIFMWVDRNYGRGTKLTIALFLLGGSTAAVAFLPSYDEIGMPVIVMLAAFRIIQGIALGGAWDGLASLSALNAPADQRGWYAMIPQLGAPIGFALAAVLFAYFVGNLSDDDFLSWGWRYPLFVAFAINVVALFARLRIVATPAFEQALLERELQPRLVLETIRTQGREILIGSFVPLAAFATIYLVTIFPLSWSVATDRRGAADMLLWQVGASVFAVVGIILSGLLADRIGRPRELLLGALLIAIFAFAAPFLLTLGQAGQNVFLLIGFFVLGISFGQSSGAVATRFAPQFRYTASAFTSDIAWLLGAAFAPLIVLALATHVGIWAIGAYLLSGAVCTALALSLTGDRKNVETVPR